MTWLSPRRHRRAAVAVVTVVLSCASVSAFSPRHAGADANYSGQASAAGLTVTAATEEDPTGTTVEAAEPVATATLSSVPDSESFAAYPYPGADLLNLVNLLGASSPAPPPPYPLEVQSSSPGQSSRNVSAPGYTLTAESTQTASHARGESGLDTAGLQFGTVIADSVVKASVDGHLKSVADTTANAIDVGPLSISSFTSHVESNLSPSGDHDATSSMSIGVTTVNGQAVGLTDRGLTLPGTNAPLPDTSPAVVALRQAGIDVTYLAASPINYGVVGPGLAITVHEQDPQGKFATVTYTLGRASATAAPGIGLTVPSLGPGDGSIGVAGLVVPQTSTGGGPSTAGSSGAAGVGAVSAPTISSISTQPAVTRHSGVSPASLSPALAGEPGILDGDFFYLLLALAAGAVLGTGQLIRFLGVR
jgi:hypothetical protein